jgi:hypothetical protein
MKGAPELQRLKRFGEIVASAMPFPGSAGASTHSELLRAITTISSVKAARTLVSDLLEWTQDLSGQDLVTLDQSLAAESLPTLTLMRSREHVRFTAILKRGRIDDDEEFQLVSARLADTASSLSDSDRALADSLLADYGP